MSRPYISFVICGRNDDYALHYLGRVQAFLNVLLPMAEKYKLPCEVLLVEWNPPADRPPLPRVLRTPRPLEFSRVRIIEVPSLYHAALDNPRGLHLFDHYARNCGIRRAEGDFVLATSSDILFSEEMIRFLASRALAENRFYRADRFDVRWAPDSSLHADQILAEARRSVFHAYFRQRRFRRGPFRIGPLRRWVYRSSGNWPSSAHRRSRRLPGQPVACLDDNIGKYDGLHLFASGDFILAPNDAWRRIRGFTEESENSAHCDSYACYGLRALGLKQSLILPPCMIFHIDHPRGAIVDPPVWIEQIRRLEKRLPIQQFQNSPDWGLGKLELKDTFL